MQLIFGRVIILELRIWLDITYILIYRVTQRVSDQDWVYLGSTILHLDNRLHKKQPFSRVSFKIKVNPTLEDILGHAIVDWQLKFKYLISLLTLF